ncbi:putative transcription factor WRKY family [Helianthus annuus]|uniref:Putative WRKY domain-containing protein n=1 Tax=Helianthus annuus TaxID=4232 RepID=A0A251TGP6_HELAN|nr:probable WRKY transcription factor 70 [Helianthus annuus]KAF5785382.1 putative transcription factor WRKY family [Helianthus annuus]KAJ0512947.1 putative transcription factor WRKY family [Helianthus annuus]KAJ0529068.1 putative transcription factor WRKY family [Helianthus annuus]
MESSTWPESLPSNRIKAIQELTKGQVLTNKLREMLDRPEKIESDIDSVNDVVVQILGMFDNTLSILSPSNLNGIPHNPTNDVRTPNISDDQKSEVSEESVKNMISVKPKRGCYKRRKISSTKTIFTYTLTDDGYAWRKYGQKVILNSKHQRNYFRCSHKFEQGCKATKQVQKTDDEPSKYKITYIGVHTCNNFQKAQIIEEALEPMDNSFLISFEKNTTVKNSKMGTCFQPMKHTSKEVNPSLSYMKYEQVSFSDHDTPWDPIVGVSQVPSEPMSIISSVLDCENMVSPGVLSSTCSTHGYGDIAKCHDLDDFLF